MAHSQTFDVYADPGHSWAKVPKRLLRELGIAHKITPYSYQRGEFAYLEEDVDAPRFAEAMLVEKDIAVQWREVQWREHIRNDESRIRDYDRYDPGELLEEPEESIDLAQPPGARTRFRRRPEVRVRQHARRRA